MKARVTVTLKNGVLDPQGKAIEGALKSLDMDQSVTIDGGANGGINMTASSKMKVNRVR